jgi:hypothetical protein
MSENRDRAMREMRLLKIWVAAGLAAGLILTNRLWLSSRLYPLAPVWPVWKPLPPPFDSMLLLALLGLLLLIVAVRRPRVFIAAFVLLAMCTAWQDQSRWQPWFYQYCFMLAAIGWGSPDRQGASLNACRLIIASIYVWSGLAKLNSNFVHHMIPFLLEPLHALAMGKLMMAAPILECGVGLGLLTRRFRRPALLCAVGMHIFVLWAIGPLGRHFNSVVWPWNVAMVAFLIILFWRADDSPRDILWGKDLAFQRVVLILFSVAPALGFFNLWDTYLSFAFYTGNENSAKIYLSDATFDRLPENLDDYVYEHSPNVNELSISDWSWDELNVPPYPETRIYRNIGRWVCDATGNPPDMKLVVQGKPALVESGRQWVYGCSELRR